MPRRCRSGVVMVTPHPASPAAGLCVVASPASFQSPGPTSTQSPGFAASTAAWIDRYVPVIPFQVPTRSTRAVEPPAGVEKPSTATHAVLAAATTAAADRRDLTATSSVLTGKTYPA